MEKLTADIIIIAGGPAGLTAAISAAQQGASVLVFEKNATTGGTANRGMGPLGIESRHTRGRLLPPTKDEAFRAFMDYTHWRVDARLVRAFLNKSGDTIHWLESLGVEFVEPATYFTGAYSTWHLVKPETGPPGPGGAATMMKILTQRAIELGVQIKLECAVSEIIREADAVVGVRATDRDGNELEARSNVVIVATGGFGNSPDMIRDYAGFEVDKDIYPFRIPGITGDGIRMAWAVGAQKTEMTMELIYGMPDPMNVPPPLHEACRQPHLLVNVQGERFLNEAIMPNVTFTANAIALQKDKTAFLIFDESILQLMKADFDTRNRVFPATRFENAEAMIAGYLASGMGNLYVADTLEDLCTQTGIDPVGLQATVAQYNEYSKTGYDEQFNKERQYLRPLQGEKWYAGRHFPSAYGSAGGIKINEKTEVIGQDWQPINGFYAAGTDACSIYGDSYPFIFPGTSMGFAVNTGRMAGENAVTYLQALKRSNEFELTTPDMAKNPHYLSQLAHLELYSPKVAETVAFLTDIVGLDETGRDDTSVYFRAWGDYFHHTLKITYRETPGMAALGWRADSEEALADVVTYLESTGAGIGWVDADPGRGRAYRFQSPDGHTHEVFWDVVWLREKGHRGSIYADRYASNRRQGVNPRRFDHVTYMVAKFQYGKEKAFWQGLGLKNPDEVRISDEIPPVGGLWTIGNLSHDVAVFTEPNIGPGEGVFNHVAFNFDSREEVLLALDYFAEKGFMSVMGAPTRHKADEGFFIYITDPGSGVLFEFYACARLIFAPDHGPDLHYLKDNPNDAWGHANPFAEMGKGHKLGLQDGVVKPVDI